MTGPELRAALDAIGMSQREFASRFGLWEGSVSRWIHDARAVPSWVQPTLNLLQKRGDAKSAQRVSRETAIASKNKEITHA